MKKLAVLFVLSIPALGLSTTLSEQLERVATQALAKSCVQVHVKLAKSVYMSDVMFRPVRGTKDTVIRTDYKQIKCTGHLSAQKNHVVVPASCVVSEDYKAAQIRLTFADGNQIQKSASAVKLQNKVAHIAL